MTPPIGFEPTLAELWSIANASEPKRQKLKSQRRVLACGQRALACVSYIASTRAKAPPKPKIGQYLSGKLNNFPPGLTLRPETRAEPTLP
jgi:hypothetical protein